MNVIVNASAPRVTNTVHPRCCLPGVEIEVFLQRIQGLQRGKPRLAVLAGPENREKPATLFREPSRFFGHHAATINFNLKSKVGDEVYENIIPADGAFQGLIDFRLVLSTGHSITIRGKRMMIVLGGRRSYVEDFKA